MQQSSIFSSLIQIETSTWLVGFNFKYLRFDNINKPENDSIFILHIIFVQAGIFFWLKLTQIKEVDAQFKLNLIIVKLNLS